MTTVTIQDATDSDGFTATIQDEATAITPLTDSGTDTSGGDDIYELSGGALELATIVDRDDGTEKDVSNIGSGGSELEVQEDGTTLATSATLLNIATGLTATEPVTDEIQVVVNESEVDHDALLNYAAAEHFTEGSISHDGIDQTTVSSADHHTRYSDEEAQDAVGTITSGGDKITVTYDDAANTLTIDTSALDTEEVEDAVNALLTAGSGITLTYDDVNDTLTVAVDEGAVDHDALLNFVANEHIDHSTVSVTAGDGLVGGGDLTASRTFDIEPADFAGAGLADDGADNLTVDTNDTGTITASGGSSPAADVTVNTTLSQTAAYDVLLYVDADPAFNADYQFNYDYAHVWDDSTSTLKIDFTVNWDTDPGAGNDVTLRWEVLNR